MSKSRQLAAIMFTDIEGYTALMQKDEAKGTMLRDRHRQIFNLTTENHGGKILQYYGDGTLSMFSSALDAVKCGLEMQKLFLDEPSIPVRIGIHVGDVMVTEEEIIGDAVNVTSRIESMATAGSVLISEKVNDEIKNHTEYKTISLGLYPFKNVDKPLQVFALANEGLIVPDTTEMLAKGKVVKRDIPNNLSNPATRFFGRKQELIQVKELLGTQRLVTLQGSGGCGKTRLAIESARQSLNLYPDGVWFVALAHVNNPELVAETIAEILQIKPEKDKPIEETIVSRISGNKLLLVIDNCEHLIDECARILNLLANETQKPTFLITSREAINISGEAIFQTPSLPFPDSNTQLHEIKEFDSIQLFRDRVLLNKPGFELDELNGPVISSICKRLNGIPLAIEMAASRVKVMDPKTILDKLSHHFNLLSSHIRTAPPRHQTMLATMEWSNELLTEDERLLFYRLSVFTGDFNLVDVEKVCGYAPLVEVQVLDLLMNLIDKSLVYTVDRNESIRYSLLEIMKQYGKSKQSGKNELEEIQEKYCNYYLTETSTAYKERVNHSIKWLAWIGLELNNIQGVFTLLQKNEAKQLELVSNLTDFFWQLAQLNVGREIINLALERSAIRNPARGRILCWIGFMEYYFISSKEGHQKVLEGSKIIQEIGDDQDKLDIALPYAMTKLGDEEFDEAEIIMSEGLQLARDLQDPLELRMKLFSAQISIARLKPEPVKDTVGIYLEEAKKSGNPYEITVAYHLYSDVPLQEGNYLESEQRYIEAAKWAMELGSVLQADIELQGIAMSVCGQGRHEKGIRLFGAAMAKFEEFGIQMLALEFWITCINRTVGKAMEAVGPKKTKKLDQEGRQTGFAEALEYAYDVNLD